MYDKSTSKPLLFILGVPRSGTTLLRVMLDSHPNLAVGPECPWIAGSYGKLTSFRDLYESLRDDPRGPVKNFEGVTEDHAARALGAAIDQLLFSFAKSRGKTRWVEKTPNHLADLPFLLKLFPDAKFVHIVRDGRDVACSSYKERKTWGPELWNPEGMIANTRLNALRRWVDWLHRFEDWEREYDFNVLQIFYEDLVRSPREVLGQVLDFFEEPWSDNVLNYKQHKHDLPSWEAGSRDVVRRENVSDSSQGRWRNEFSQLECLIASGFADPTLIKYGYEPTISVSESAPVIGETIPQTMDISDEINFTKAMIIRLIRTDYPHLSAHSGLHQFVKYISTERFKINVDLIRMGDEELDNVPPEIISEIKRLIRSAGIKAYQGNDFTSELRTMQDWTKGEFDLLHYMDGEHTLQLLPAAMNRFSALKPPAPVVATFHQPPSELKKLLNREILQAVDAVMVLTPEQRDWFREFLPVEKVRLILHGLDTDFFKPAASKPDDGVLRCLTVGNWLRDYETVFRVAEAMNGQESIEFHIVTGKFKGLQLPGNVRVHADISDDELLGLYRKCDVVFLPLLDATANNAILEGIGCGLGIVSTDIPGVRAYVPGDEALLVRDNRIEDYKIILNGLGKESEIVREMGKTARKRAMQLSWVNVTKEIESMYAQLLSLTTVR